MDDPDGAAEDIEAGHAEISWSKKDPIITEKERTDGFKEVEKAIKKYKLDTKPPLVAIVGKGPL